MDQLERRLREYDEWNEAQISEEFLHRLKTLEAAPEAAQKPRRRYVLPVAAAVALAICLGSVWAWLHFSRPGDHRTPPAVTLEEPSIPKADSPAAPSEPAPQETKPKTELIYTSKPPAEEPSPALPIFSPKPVQDGTAQPNSDTPAASRPEEPAPAAPDDQTPAATEDTAPVKPEDPAPDKPDDPASAAPDAPAPSEETNPPPDDPNPPKPDDPKPPEPEDPDPPGPTEVDPPDEPQIPPEIGVVYLNAGGKETLTLTLMSTGEIVEIDVTGWQEEIGDAPTSPTEYHEAPSYVGLYYAFGEQILYQLKLSPDGTVSAEASVFDPYHLIENGKENNHEA